MAALGYVLLTFWLLYLALRVTQLFAGRAVARAHRQTPVGSMTDALLNLLDRLGYEPGMVRHAARAACVDLLEQVARGQEQVIGSPPPVRRGSRSAAQLAHRHRAAGVAAATRDLKELVVHPVPGAWADLRARLGRVLASTAHGWWGELPEREPDPVRKVLARRAVVVLRALLVIGIPPGVLAFVQLEDLPPDLTIPLEIALVVYLGWPLLSLMWWLDPNLADKLSALRAGREQLRGTTPQQGSRGSGGQ